jgi:hypothetical protein
MLYRILSFGSWSPGISCGCSPIPFSIRHRLAGAARLIYAGLVLVAISTGLLLGLALLGVSLPVDEAGLVVGLILTPVARGRHMPFAATVGDEIELGWRLLLANRLVLHRA